MARWYLPVLLAAASALCAESAFWNWIPRENDGKYPDGRPFPPHYSDSNHYALAFTPSEEVRILAAPHAVQCCNLEL